MEKLNIGLIGLGVMGSNLALNIERNGFSMAVYNRNRDKTDAFMNGPAAGKKFTAAYTFDDFTAMLELPRRIILMVSAGQAVDAVIEQLKPYLSAGDILIDAGNSYFLDTERRSAELEKQGFQFMGMGVSGGEEGAQWGPSLMPGGQEAAWKGLSPIWEKIAAKAPDGEACVTHIGPRGAGHFVKMVHNGIEYGDMQLIAEVYDVLRRGLGLSADELHQVFAEWNQHELRSYLIEITADIFKHRDPDSGKPLVDMILDEAQQKGTGKWTSQIALDIGAPIPTINAAVESRILSSMKKERMTASRILSGPVAQYSGGERDALIQVARDALYASKITSYAQGLDMMRIASREFGYGLNMREIARIWRAGCIIRASLLDEIMVAYQRNPALENLLLDDQFRTAVEDRQASWRYFVQTAVGLGIPVPGIGASLAYFDAYRSATLPANLTQAQRDYFGAHTYRRIDREGSFHTGWTE